MRSRYLYGAFGEATCVRRVGVRPVRHEAVRMGTPTDIILYQAEWCPYCARVRAKLTDLLLDYKVVNEPRDHASRAATKAASGQTSIPVMVDGDVTLDDDDDILPYLDKKYGANV
jgi:glutaredoxin